MIPWIKSRPTHVLPSCLQFFSGSRTRDAPVRVAPSLKKCTLPFDKELGHGWDTEYGQRFPVKSKVRGQMFNCHVVNVGLYVI